MERNYSYEETPKYFQTLINLNFSKNNMMQKSVANDELSGYAEEIGENNKHVDVLAKAINQGFNDLNGDYLNGNLNQVRYVDYLRKYKDFFETEISKSDIPHGLNTLQILDQVEKYCGKVAGDVREYIIAKENNKKIAAQAQKPIANVSSTIKKSISPKPILFDWTNVDKSLAELDVMVKQTQQRDIEFKKRLLKK